MEVSQILIVLSMILIAIVIGFVINVLSFKVPRYFTKENNETKL